MTRTPQGLSWLGIVTLEESFQSREKVWLVWKEIPRAISTIGSYFNGQVLIGEGVGLPCLVTARHRVFHSLFPLVRSRPPRRALLQLSTAPPCRAFFSYFPPDREELSAIKAAETPLTDAKLKHHCDKAVRPRGSLRKDFRPLAV